MTLREELFNIAKKVVEEQEAQKQARKLVVDNYLKNICNKAASIGKFSVDIPYIKLEDGNYLTDEETIKFAEENDLDFRPSCVDVFVHLPKLSFNEK